MARTVGQVSINLDARTAQFMLDMEKANGKVVEFKNKVTEAGSHGVSSVQATSAALRVLEGGLNNNLRAAERFLANVLGLGPALQALFPLAGGLAFLGILGKVTEEAKKFYESLKYAQQVTDIGFRKEVESMELMNAQLAVNIDNINREIAKLEGTHTNSLKEMIDAANLSAVKLNAELDQTATKIGNLLREHAPGFQRQFLGGETSTFNAQLLLGGPNKEGGEIDTGLTAINQKYAGQIQSARTLAEVSEVMRQKQAEQLTFLDKELTTVNRLWKEQKDAVEQARQAQIEWSQGVGDTPPAQTPKNEALIKDYQLIIDYINRQKDAIRLTNEEFDRGNRLRQDQDKKRDSREEGPFERRRTELEAQIKGLAAEIGTVGESEEAQALSKAFLRAGEAVAAINSRLRQMSPNLKLSDDQAQELLNDFEDAAGLEINSDGRSGSMKRLRR